MKNLNFLKVIVLIASIHAITLPLPIGATDISSPVKMDIASSKDTKEVNTEKYSPKTGYEIDGNSSASKLVAKRSHAVSEQDRTGLTVFLGVIVIGVILFFLTGRKT